MGRGGKREAGPGKKIGRPANETRALERLHKEVKADLAKLQDEIRVAFADGVAVMAASLPGILEKMVRKAMEDDDSDMQKHLSDRFFKFFQPDMVVVNETPMQEFLKRLREATSDKLDEDSERAVINAESRLIPDGHE